MKTPFIIDDIDEFIFRNENSQAPQEASCLDYHIDSQAAKWRQRQAKNKQRLKYKKSEYMDKH